MMEAKKEALKYAYTKDNKKIGCILAELGSDRNAIPMYKGCMVIQVKRFLYGKCTITLATERITKKESYKVWFNLTNKELSILLKQYWSNITLLGKKAKQQLTDEQLMTRATISENLRLLQSKYYF